MDKEGKEAFDAYIAVRSYLPQATFADTWQVGESLETIAAPYDVIMLDAYGVLNVGETAIDGAIACIASLRKAGKRLMVVSNSAAYPKPHMMERYTRLGFDFLTSEVVTSREALLANLAGYGTRRWGMMLNASHGKEDLEGIDGQCLGDDPALYDTAEGFLLFGSDGWSDERQKILETSLRANPRPVIVGNPDIVAPREAGLSREPGFFAHRLSEKLGLRPRFIGKPFNEIYDLALKRLMPQPVPSRVLMVGDTLHTDVLGGKNMGFDTALVTQHGLLAGLNVSNAIRRCGIVPDFVISQI
jgi:HAD superfamily hydrolase (TIGR01450 family)